MPSPGGKVLSVAKRMRNAGDNPKISTKKQASTG